MRILDYNEDTIIEVLDILNKRDPGNYSIYEEVVNGIVDAVRTDGDKAIYEYTKKFDGFELNNDNIMVNEDEIAAAYGEINPEYIMIMNNSASNIHAYHEKQLRNSWFDTSNDGSILGLRYTPIENVGVYVPGGKAAYPSSVLMNVIPAIVAGVENIMICTPADADGKVNPATLVAADIAGVHKIAKIGGAQAIAAMAFGTDSIQKVDKITGPGNIYVALAKKRCFGHVSIDSIAGPSEILIIADDTANYKYVAADLLSQAEHDELASSILLTTDKKLAKAVADEVDRLIGILDRGSIIKKSIEDYGFILVSENMNELIDIANTIASEHLEIITKNPYNIMTKIKNAGAIFLGEYSCEPLGDYYAGPNHVLPTNGTARFFSPLGVDDFIKKTSIISYSEEGLASVYKEVATFAHNEGLTAHEHSIRVRFEDRI